MKKFAYMFAYLLLVLSSALWMAGCLRDRPPLVLAASACWEHIETLAILPVQNASGNLVRLSFNSGTLASIWDRIERRAFVRSLEYEKGDTLLVVLEEALAGVLRKKGFRVSEIKQVRKRYLDVSSSGIPFDLEAIKQNIPADAYLFLLIRHWQGDDYAYNGTIQVGYEATLIRAADGATLWKFEEKKRSYDIFLREGYSENEIIRGEQAYVDLRRKTFVWLSRDILQAFPSVPVSVKNERAV